ncbi:MAG: glycosyltransferase family 4 protein [Desulfovibrio sp.]
MKIAVIAGFGPSLVNFRGPLLQEMVKAGHEVVGIAPPEGFKGDQVHIADQLRPLGVRFRPVFLCRTGMNPMDDLKTLHELYKIFREEKPDAVFSYTIKPVVWGSLAARMAGVPAIYSMITGLGYAFGQMGLYNEHGLKRRALYQLVKGLYKTGLLFNKTVFFQNPDDREMFQRFGIISEQKKAIVTNGSGVDLDHYAYTPRLPEKPIFTCIARLLGEKGLREYAAAAALLKPKYPHAEFRIIGPVDDGPDAITGTELDQWREENALTRFGEVDDVRPYLEDTTVFVLPSYREGTPRSVLEAMSIGRAIITTDTPGCRETVQHNKTGLLVPAREIFPLADAMESFLKDTDKAARMGEAGRVYAEQKFDIHKVNKLILDTLEL